MALTYKDAKFSICRLCGVAVYEKEIHAQFHVNFGHAIQLNQVTWRDVF